MRSTSFAAAAAAAIGTLLAAGCGSTTASSGPPISTAVTSNPAPVPTTSRNAVATDMPPAHVSIPIVTTSTGENLPISVQSDSQMKAEGNNGPSSSILLPTSCRLTGRTVTAEGSYTNGGFVPNVYNRYGDIIVLYVFGAASPGYAHGIQLGVSDAGQSLMVGTPAPWHVASLYVGKPSTCVVAAQPTHDVQLAP